MKLNPCMLLVLAPMVLASCGDNKKVSATIPTRGLSQAQLGGSCQDACDGQSLDGNCWCDSACEQWGDCCGDYEDQCGATECQPVLCTLYCEDGFKTDEHGCEICECIEEVECAPNLCTLACEEFETDEDGCEICECAEESSCEDENPAGCVSTGCGEGYECQTDVDACIPSACSCNEGGWICTTDCGGGICVPTEPNVCEGENPQGCTNTGCDDGYECKPDVDECIPSACSCDEYGWLCTADCSGGKCVPKETECAPVVCTLYCEDGFKTDEDGCEICECNEPSEVCEGENPAGCVESGCPDGQECVTDTDECIPSACSCDPEFGWFCTTDCGGGFCQ